MLAAFLVPVGLDLFDVQQFLTIGAGAVLGTDVGQHVGHVPVARRWVGKLLGALLVVWHAHQDLAVVAAAGQRPLVVLS